MFMAFVGMLDAEYTELCIRGNGKTCSMVFYLYFYFCNGYEVWTNFKTKFSKVKGFQRMINDLRKLREDEDKRKVPKSKRKKIVLGVSEMQDLINSVGTTTQQAKFVNSFASQIRKLDADCFYDAQVFKNVHIGLRRHTEHIRIPFKTHIDGSECNYDRCTQNHYIEIYSQKPFKKKRIKRIKAWIVGKLYNTTEIIYDVLVIPKENTTKPG